MGKGIDYGMGRTNVNHETGIRYGVISTHSMSAWFWDGVENDYGTPHCPKCGNDAIASDDKRVSRKRWDNYRTHGCNDFACVTCKHFLDSDVVYSEEALGWTIDSDGIKAQDCLDSDAMVLSSPYYTHAIFCSPCVPGACSLDSPDPDGARAYCFGHDWFDGGKAPYPVYSVKTGELVQPDTDSGE